MTTQDKIEQAAEQFAFVVPYNGTDKFYNTDKLQGFKAGAEYVLSNIELMREHIIAFYDWYQQEGYKTDVEAMMGLSTNGLFTLYLEHLKQKQ